MAATEGLDSSQKGRISGELDRVVAFGERENYWARRLSPEQKAYIRDLIFQTLREVVDRGGFIRELTRHRDEISKLRTRIETEKTDLADVEEQIRKKHEHMDTLVRTREALLNKLDLVPFAVQERFRQEISSAGRTIDRYRHEIKVLRGRQRWLVSQLTEVVENLCITSETYHRLRDAREEKARVREAAKVENIPPAQIPEPSRSSGGRMVTRAVVGKKG